MGTSQQHERGDLNQGAIVINVVIFAIIVLTGVLFVGLMHRLKLGWIVAPEKWLSLVAGWAIVWSVSGIIETFQHTGGGMITETEGADREGNGGSDRRVWADEWEYKRTKVGEYGMFLGIAIFVWGVILKKEHDEKVEEEFRVASHARSSAAESERLQAYLSAIEKWVWQTAHEQAEAAMEASAYVNSVGMSFKLIPAVTFMIRSPESKADRFEDEGLRSVTISSPFSIGVHEVTQSQYESVMGNNPSCFKGANNPVEMVSWDDAVAFCAKLSALPAEVAAGCVYRLPTEAEWEHACRADTTTAYSFGDDAKDLGKYAWFGDNSGDTISDSNSLWAISVESKDYAAYIAKMQANGCTSHAVGKKLPNGWGLYDMHGNVWEWCSDVYDKSESGSQDRVLRGGSWISNSGSARSASRNGHQPGTRVNVFGFRVVR